MSFTFHKLEIPDVVLIQPNVHTDGRGVFAELFKFSDFAGHGIKALISQINSSYSKKHVLRGLHYQLDPKAQGKLISVAAGEIFDAAVDIRKDSQTFGKWVGRRLTAETKEMLWVPPGFAHGFCVESNAATVIYFCTEEYAPDAERGIIWNDPAVGIEWPTTAPIVSAKDAAFPRLEEAEINYAV